MKINQKTNTPIFTAQGGKAQKATVVQTLRRLVNACMLWEDNFYVDGQSLATMISELVNKVSPQDAQSIAINARNSQKLRHVPLLVAREMARGSKNHRLLVADTLTEIIQRPDELTEFLAIYWKDGKQPLSAQVKKGLGRAFNKFNEYSFAKYNQDKDIKLRDVLFLSHAKPKNLEQNIIFDKLVDNELKTPDTWEVALSGGANKKETFTRLILEGKLGAMALLRNLRNMISAGVSDNLIREAIVSANVEKVLPFRFIAAARYAPQFEPELEKSMFKCLENHEQLNGETVLLVDVSGSMSQRVSNKSELSRLDAACGLAMLLREVSQNVKVYTFDDDVKMVPSRRGFALADAIKQDNGGYTYLQKALLTVAKNEPHLDRLIVISDEQSADNVTNPFIDLAQAYMVNVASNQYGVAYGNGWKRVDGWSESIVDYILAEEQEYQKGAYN